MRSKKALYNVITNLSLQIIIVIYGFIVPKIIISSFGSNVNGLLSSITQFLAYISLLESGFGPVVKSTLYKSIAKKSNKDIENILKTTEKFFRTIALIFLVYIILLCFLLPIVVSNNFDYLYTVSLIIIVAISTFAEYFFGMTYRLFLQADQKSYVISIIQIVTYILSIFSIVILANIGANIHLIKLVSGLIFVLRPIMQNYYVKKKYNINFKNADSNFKLKQKWDGLAQHIAAVIHGNTDITILTFFTSLSEVSVYSVYYLVVKGVKSIIQSFTNGIDSSFGDMIAKKEFTNLNRKFSIYETIYFTIITIAFSSTIILITPFISVYTKGINDVVYLRCLFGYLLVISEFIWAIRLPYSSITLAAGHFKETRIGAWVEAFVNIVVSMILVWKFGINGVAIGTIIAMSIRTLEFVYHTNKYILNRKISNSLKNLLIVIVETLIIFFLSRYIPYLNNSSYGNWFINAAITFIFATLIVLVINIPFYWSNYKYMCMNIKKMLKSHK